LEKNKQQPDQRKARTEPNNGKIPNPGQKVKDNTDPETMGENRHQK